MLEPMVETLMYEVDEEGGPRCSCVHCFYKSKEHLQASYLIPEGRPVLEDAIRLEEEYGFTMKDGVFLSELLEPVRKGW